MHLTVEVNRALIQAYLVFPFVRTCTGTITINAKVFRILPFVNDEGQLSS